ncbi:MAG: hypothetical protein ACYDGN_10505 [Acidimicrobiales bacterium]
MAEDTWTTIALPILEQIQEGEHSAPTEATRSLFTTSNEDPAVGT